MRKKIFSELRKNEKSSIPNSTKIGNYTNCIISPDAYIYFGNKIDIRNNCNFVIGKKAELKIRDAVFINNSCSINCLEKIEHVTVKELNLSFNNYKKIIQKIKTTEELKQFLKSKHLYDELIQKLKSNNKNKKIDKI